MVNGQKYTLMEGSTDAKEWDAFVRRHPLGWMCALSGWQRVIEHAFPHIRGHVLTLRDADGAIRAGLPIYTVKSWLLGTRLVSVPFATLSDPLVASREDAAGLLALLRRFQTQLSVKRVEIKTSKSTSYFEVSDFMIDRFYKHHFLYLDRPPDILRKSFGRTAIRQMISKAAKKGVAVSCASAEHELHAFYDLFSETRRRLALPASPYRFFQAMWKAFQPDGHVLLLMARYQGQLAGGVLILKWGNTFALEYACDIPQFRKDGVIQLLYWEALRMAHAESYKVFSFGRTSPNNSGLMAFKAHWGTQVEDLPLLITPPTMQPGMHSSDQKWQYRSVRALTRYAPRFFHQGLSNFLYGHWG